MDDSLTFPGLSEEQHEKLWGKAAELDSFHAKLASLNSTLSDLIKEYQIQSIHFQYRSPLSLSMSYKEMPLEKVHATYRPENTTIRWVTDQILVDFVQNLKADRISLVQKYSQDPQILNKKKPYEIHMTSIAPDLFFTTYVFPSLFGQFSGEKNLTDFISAVGLCFDFLSSDQDRFLESFSSSLLCRLLRQFFFSPPFRPFMVEQFTVFYDFFSSSKKTPDPSNYTRYQRFLSLFLNELITPFPSAPVVISRLFRRICSRFDDKSKVVLCVILHCIIIPLIVYPCALGVLPLTANYHQETSESINFLKHYCQVVFGLPCSKTQFSAIRDIDKVDRRAIDKVVEVLLSDGGEEEWGCDVTDIVMPFSVLKILAEYEGTAEIMGALKGGSEDIVGFDLSAPKSEEPRNPFFELLVGLHPKSFAPSEPRLKALRNFVSAYANPEAVLGGLSASSDRTILKMAEAEERIKSQKAMVACCKKAIEEAETIAAFKICLSIDKETAVISDLDRKANLFYTNSDAFANHFISCIEQYYSKNSWIGPLLPHVAKRLHAKVMEKFPLPMFCQKNDQLVLIDQQFLNQKMDVLNQLEASDLDPNVAKLLKSGTIFAPAQTAVLRACLFENCYESAKQIVLSMFVVENLFNFEFGAPPEANQLLPLLANLFIRSPMPTPLSFGKWLQHFLNPLIKAKPEWFGEDELRPLEHYFRFNVWMEEGLQKLSAEK